MKATRQDNSFYLDLLTSLSGQSMNASAIMKATKLVREIKSLTGAAVTLSENGFFLDLVHHCEIMQSQKIDTMLYDLIRYLLNNCQQTQNTAREVASADINTVVQQLALRSKVINAVTRAKTKSDAGPFKIQDNLAQNSQKTVLVVDDDTDLLPLISNILSRLGFKSLVASGGQEALDIIGKGGKLDLLLTDIQMPFMNGFNLASKVKKILPNVGILYMSAYQEYASGDYKNNVDVDARLLQKPFAIPVLHSALNDALIAA